jgi:KEOPS complex subunit Cgi121
MKELQEPCEIRVAEFTVQDQAGLLAVIRDIARLHKTHIVCFDAEKMTGRRHAKMAICRAERSFVHGTPVSNSFEMEALLYAAGSRQCTVAVSWGIHDGFNTAYVCCCPPCDAVWSDLSKHMRFISTYREDMTQVRITRLMALYGITSEELDAAGGIDRIVDLVLERVALLEVYK